MKFLLIMGSSCSVCYGVKYLIWAPQMDGFSRSGPCTCSRFCLISSKISLWASIESYCFLALGPKPVFIIMIIEFIIHKHSSLQFCFNYLIMVKIIGQGWWHPSEGKMVIKEVTQKHWLGLFNLPSVCPAILLSALRFLSYCTHTPIRGCRSMCFWGLWISIYFSGRPLAIINFNMPDIWQRVVCAADLWNPWGDFIYIARTNPWGGVNVPFSVFELWLKWPTNGYN